MKDPAVEEAEKLRKEKEGVVIILSISLLRRQSGKRVMTIN